MEFGATLRQLRQQAGLTQQQLADRSEVPIGTIRDYEQGKRDPLLSTARQLALSLRVSLDQLASLTPPSAIQEPAAKWEPRPRGRPRKPLGEPGKASAEPEADRAEADWGEAEKPTEEPPAEGKTKRPRRKK